MERVVEPDPCVLSHREVRRKVFPRAVVRRRVRELLPPVARDRESDAEPQRRWAGGVVAELVTEEEEVQFRQRPLLPLLEQPALRLLQSQRAVVALHSRLLQRPSVPLCARQLVLRLCLLPVRQPLRVREDVLPVRLPLLPSLDLRHTAPLV